MDMKRLSIQLRRGDFNVTMYFHSLKSSDFVKSILQLSLLFYIYIIQYSYSIENNSTNAAVQKSGELLGVEFSSKSYVLLSSP